VPLIRSSAGTAADGADVFGAEGSICASMATTSNGINAAILRCVVEELLSGIGLEVILNPFPASLRWT